MTGFDVELKTRVPSDVYRRLVDVARDSNVDVAVVAASVLTRAARPRQTKPPRQPRTRVTDELLIEIGHLDALGNSKADIAKRVGVSLQTVYTHIDRAQNRYRTSEGTQ